MPRAISPARRILNCIPSRDTDNDWSLENAVEADIVAAAPVIPESVDLRQPWWEVGDQGTTGCCVGWATADALLRWHFVQSGRITPEERLSVRYIWMAAKETDQFTNSPTTFIEGEGTSLKAALDIARKYGAVTDQVLPFGTPKLFSGSAKTFYAIAAQLKITAYFNLKRDADNWRRWLATSGPILTRLDVDTTWDHATSTVGQLDVYKPLTARGGHAVAIVGYTPGSFIIRNSWGNQWGDCGFAYASIDYAQAAFTESYGIVLM